MDEFDMFAIIFSIIGIGFGTLIIVLVAFIGIDLKTDADAKRKCYELTYEEYKIDARCQELLED